MLPSHGAPHRASPLGALLAVGWLVCGTAACAEPPELPTDAAGSGTTLEGSIVLAEGFELPTYAPADLSRRTLMAAERAADPACASVAADAARPLRLGAERGLEGVVVAAAEFVRHKRRKAKVHSLVLEGCRLSPRTLVAQRGDRLRIENRDDRAYPLTLGPTVEVGELPAGGELVLDLGRIGVEPILCAAPSICGRADVFVLYHPVAAVTGKDGRFRIEDFPAGEGVVVGAWHPLLTEARTTLWLSGGEQVQTRIPVRPHDAPDE